VSKAYRIYQKPIDRLKQALRWGRRRYFREFWALREVSMRVQKGEMVGIIGRNGSGKSTLLQIIAGTLAPTAGEVHMPRRVAALLELGSGFHMDATGRENVYMNGAILGLTDGEIEAKYDEIRAFADIGDFIDQPIKTYSSGMLVRLAFAVAAHVDADVLIVDEALSVGDAAFQAKCFRRIEALRERGATVLLATHDTTIVERLCSHAVLLDQGTVALADSGKEVAREYYRQVRQLQRMDAPPHDRVTGSKYTGNGLDKPRSGQGTRMGDQSAEILGYAVYDEDGVRTTALSARRPCQFVVVVRFAAELANPHVGVALRDVHSRLLIGGHTLFDECPVGAVWPGVEIRVTFTMNMNLRPGNYLLMIGVADHQDLSNWKDCDVYFDLCEIQVHGEVSWGVVNVPTTVKIER
jgi:ABC-type polysaccharide/polyol phosphate transport system ATPase subunit